MWIKQATYISLEKQVSAQGATIEWLRNRVNQLERRNALFEGRAGIPPIDVPQIERADLPAMANPPAIIPQRRESPDAPTRDELLSGNMNFEDMGDDRAKASGVAWDHESGMVTYR